MKQIPFFANLPDGTHCYQAALKMVLGCFSQKEISFEELDKISAKLEGKWTWPTTSLIWLLDEGFEIKLIEQFSYEEFGKRGKDYLLEQFGEEVAKAQEANSDLDREQKLALQFAKRITVSQQTPTWEDLENVLREGYLVICNVNAAVLYHQKGYSGHFVVPVQIMPRELILHDPGLPPKASLRVSQKIFEKAWGYPSEREKNILAIRPQK